MVFSAGGVTLLLVVPSNVRANRGSGRIQRFDKLKRRVPRVPERREHLQGQVAACCIKLPGFRVLGARLVSATVLIWRNFTPRSISQLSAWDKVRGVP